MLFDKLEVFDDGLALVAEAEGCAYGVSSVKAGKAGKACVAERRPTVVRVLPKMMQTKSGWGAAFERAKPKERHSHKE